MKKFAVILVIVSMVVLDLTLSGIDVLFGLSILGVALVACAVIDYAGHAPKRTTSITEAARRNRRSQLTSRLGSSSSHPSLDGWQRCSQDLQFAK